MRDFFSSLKFKILIGFIAVLAGVMAYAAANGRLTAAPQEILGALAKPFQQLTTSVSNNVEEFFENYIKIGDTISENEELEKEMTEMLEKMVDYETIKAENEQLKMALEIVEENPSYKTLNANVIGRDPLEKYYSFTIDKGSRHGVEVKDCIIGSDGIIGRVVEVSATYSKVNTILDPSVSVGSIVSRTRDNGLIGGDLELSIDKKCKMTLLPRDSLAISGDTVITTGLGGVFPKNLIVGSIEDILPEPSGTSLYAVIEPAEDIENVKMVMIITDFEE